MESNQILPLLSQALKIKNLDKSLKKELKETIDRVGDHLNFLQKFDIERILLIPENSIFSPKDMAAAIIKIKLTENCSPLELNDLLSIAGRKENSSEGPGMGDRQLASEILSLCLKHKGYSGFDLVKLIIILGDKRQFDDKDLARNVAEKVLAEVNDVDALEFAIEVVEDPSFLGDQIIADKLKEKMKGCAEG